MRRDDRLRLRQLPTVELDPDDVAAIRAVLETAFGGGDGFGEDDWQHALGGVHFVLDVGGQIVAHASVVVRELHAGGRPLRTGYVEAVATRPDHQRHGLGTRLMQAVNAHVDDAFELGALSTGRHAFYRRLGWQTWRGPRFVRVPQALERTPDDDGGVLVLRTRSSPELDLDAPLSCDWRSGDPW